MTTAGERYHSWNRTVKWTILIITAVVISLPFALISGLEVVEIIPLIGLTISGFF